MNPRVCWALVPALCLSSMALAQPAIPEPAPCTDDETVIGCFQRIQEQAAPEAAENQVDAVKAEQKQAVKQELATAQNGADSGGTATAATTNDLAQLLNALGLLSSGDNAEGSKLSVDLNFLLPVQDVENNNAQLKAVINTEAKPLEQLVQAFPEDVRAARKDAFQKDIATFGDTQISFTWSLVNSRFGRDYSVLRERIAPMNQGAVTRGRNTAAQEMRAVSDLPQLIQRINTERAAATPAQPAINAATRFRDLPISSEQKQELKASAFKAAAARAAVTRSIQAELASSGMNRLAELVEQQPQLLFTLTHEIRNDLVGPETTSATVSWEITRRNFGAFLRNEGKSCAGADVAEAAAAYTRCANALQSYLGSDDNDLSKQWRTKLSASYKRVKAVTYSYPGDNVNLLLPKHDRWEIALAMGRPMSQDEKGGRVDFELAYDSNLDDDTTNQERFKATLTYTRRVGDMDMPFSIVYANKDEFLGEVDHQISMNVGLRFRQPAK